MMRMIAVRHSGNKVDINGILLLNKPTGISSNAALQAVKTLFKARKAGHSGSLDPLATGMLPICFGEATKFSQYVLDADKSYRVVGELGVKTTTADREGDIIATVTDFDISRNQLDEVLQKFRGVISQVPSMFSALKHNGVPLYKLARQGIEVERKPRQVTIYQLEVLAFDGKQFELEVTCSKGTYIRNLVEDIGDALGVGAHVAQLHRIYVNPYQHSEMVELDDLKSIAENPESGNLTDLIKPLESMLDDYAIIELDEAATKVICNGQSIEAPVGYEQGFVKLVTQSKNLLGVGEVTAGKIIPRRLVNRRIVATSNA